MGITSLFRFQCFLICTIVAVSNFQYGFDTGVRLTQQPASGHTNSCLDQIVNGFQATQGFLRVFGVPGADGQFTIQVRRDILPASLI